MHRLFERLRKNQEGLTLIELIVVVAIIGVLAWLITPRVLEALKSSKVNSAESAANEFLAALERYASEKATYPADPTATAGEASMKDLFSTLNISVTKTGSYFDVTTFKYDTPSTTDLSDFCAVIQASQAKVDGTNTYTHVWIGKQGVFWGTGTTVPTDLTNCAATTTAGKIVPD